MTPHIFPNPSEGKLVVETLAEKTIIQLQDCFGKTLLQEEFNGVQHQLDLSLFPAGVYFLRLNTASYWFSEKIIRR